VIKCTTLKHWRAIDVHMLVNVMDLVHLYRHCVRHHGRPLDDRIVLSGVLAVFLYSKSRFLRLTRTIS